MKRIIIVSMLFLAIAFSQAVYRAGGEVRLSPRLLNYQGFLTDTLNNPISNPSISMTFTIFDAASTGNQKWTETQSAVNISKGIFHVLLGSVASIPDSVFNNSNRWLELSVAGQTLAPRTRIVSAPYAYTATYSDTAGYARNSAPDNDWNLLVTDGADTTLQAVGRWGLARAGNMLYGNADSTHVNFGVACTTGTSGQNNKYCTVAGGRSNRASGENATVGGGNYNTAGSSGATVAGGDRNVARGQQSTVGGGYNNLASDYWATVAGGLSNVASGDNATVGGGYNNIASQADATVGGGDGNAASGQYSTVGGGTENTASSYQSTVGGGYANAASEYFSTVAGGYADTASAEGATVGGGYSNTASGVYATVGGGFFNNAEGSNSTITGGYANTITMEGQYSYLFGINSNLTQDSTFMVDLPHIRFGTEANGYEFPSSRGTDGQLLATDSTGQLIWSFGGSDAKWIFHVSDGADTTLQMGGRWGLARAGNVLYGNADSTHVNFGVACTTGGGSDDKYCTVSGGKNNRARVDYTTIGGGLLNIAEGMSATVSGGNRNIASGQYSMIGGGELNKALGNNATVGGGGGNTAAEYATVSGGFNNNAEGNYATIGGGFDNYVGGILRDYSTVGGGHANSANDSSSTIGGGEFNSANAYGAVGGGKLNGALGSFASVGGGYNNNAEAGYASIVGGYENYAAHYFTAIGGGRKNTAYDSNATVGGGYSNYAGGRYSTIVGGFADTITATGDYSYLFGINSNLTQDSTFMVDLPHTWFGTEATGYEFPRQRGADGQVLGLGASGQLGWITGVADADWVISGSDMYSGVAGNVGIGTTTPRGKLDVDGPSDIWLVDDGLQSGSQNIHIPGSVFITPYATGNVAYFQARRSDNSGSTELRFRTFNSGAVTEAMHLSSMGHVGMGTTAPDTTLHIVGNIKMVDGNQSVGKVLTSDALGLGTWQIPTMDNDWNFRITDGNDTTLVTSSRWGLARAGNILYGTADSTHVNLGVACATGFSGQNYKYCTVAGGYNNKASNQDATVGGGLNNTASGDNATVGGGESNVADSTCAFVGGGNNNSASGRFATIGGGNSNTVSGRSATIGGGVFNSNAGDYSVIAGGSMDTLTSTADFSCLFGINSKLTQDSTFMVDMPHTWFGTEAAGYEFPRQRGTDGQVMVTNASGQLSWATASGADNDWNYLVSDGADTTLQMGGRWGLARSGNTLYGTADSTHVNFGGACTTGTPGQNFKYCTVSGGYLNKASGERATVSGGYDNTASGTHATVGGGLHNDASNYSATVGGGYGNAAGNYYATVAGGRVDTVAAYYGFASNFSTKVNASDTNSAAFTTSHTIAKNQVRAAAFSTGTLEFAMDHPDDPMNKILNQYAVGSDEVMLIYRGSVVLDANGRAAVNLPDYFDDINRNPMVQLTGVGSPDVVYVAEDVHANSFVIGGKPDMKVYWTVTAERRDIHAEIARIQTPVVQEKAGDMLNHSIDDDAMIGMYDGLNRKNPELFKFKTDEGRGVHEQSKKIIGDNK